MSPSERWQGFPVVIEGIPFVIAPLALAVAAWGLGWPLVGAVFFGLAVFVLWFFRNPDRAIPSDPNAIVSPADGRVLSVEKVFESRVLKEDAQRVSIFMGLTDVHVNRIPYQGLIVGAFYHPGKFLSAFKEKASLDNEQQALLLETPEGKRILFIQIAGLVARRIVTWVREGARVERGARYGLIRFGSRMDVYLPLRCRVTVKPGDRVAGGSSVLGVWS
ncbi:MAG: phosphatidylserine decarboxylase family protein [Nitrospirae bacterium]|nr:phosphatidylserine decarboxylase family protein [Nitrospirota bacterium]